MSSISPVKEVEIENFKSIKHLKIECRRVNIFIGEPNTGKSNILEAVVGFPSSIGHGFKLQDAVRFERLSNIFYDEEIDREVKINFKERSIVAGVYNDSLKVEAREKVNGWHTTSYELRYHATKSRKWKWGYVSYYNVKKYEEAREWLKRFKFYRFERLYEFPNKSSDFLAPPSGNNLVSLLTKSRELRETANDIISRFGFKLTIKPRENKLEIQRELEEGVIVSFPYTLVSDTIQRVIFYSAAVLTNKNSVIAMEEPEAHAFPYYTKYLAELIAMDENQYFITTHNPYFLLSLIEKTPKSDIAIFLTYYKDYQTKVKRLSEKELQEILDTGMDVFFNMQRFLED